MTLSMQTSAHIMALVSPKFSSSSPPWGSPSRQVRTHKTAQLSLYPRARPIAGGRFGPAFKSPNRPTRAYLGEEDLGSWPSTRRHSIDSEYQNNEKVKGSTLSSVKDMDIFNAFERGGGQKTDARDPERRRPRLPLRQRLHHFTWAWFSVPVATGGLAVLIYAQPYQFPGLHEIGVAFYIATLLVNALCWLGILSRFYLYPADFHTSVRHSREGFFLAMAFQAFANVLTSTQRYAVPYGNWLLVTAVRMGFWLYVIGTLVLAVGQYSYVFRAHRFVLHAMMPVWILPIFPVMLSGTVASVIAETAPASHAIPMVVAGLTCQGLGISVTFLMYAHMLGRLMTAGLPNREDRPGLFMNVGPPAFTALALIGMARILPPTFDASAGGFVDASMMRDIAVFVATFLWALSFWWFGIAALAVMHSRPRHFHIGWWAIVFPNTGFILATISIGNAFQNDAVRLTASFMSVVQLVMYLFVLVNHVKAVWKQEIMYPGLDEDVDDS